MNETLPINKQQAIKAKEWLLSNFEININKAIAGTQYSSDLVCAIACQETAYRWLAWLKYPVSEILACCVFDASGDFKGTTRNAFPKNATEFARKYGNEFTEMLIEEGNKMRHLMDWHDANYLYKGYGIFQYDLQHIVTDVAFFKNKLWYNFDECLSRLIKELNDKSKKHSDLHSIVKAYNGAGDAAENYANNVFKFQEMIS